MEGEHDCIGQKHCLKMVLEVLMTEILSTSSAKWGNGSKVHALLLMTAMMMSVITWAGWEGGRGGRGLVRAGRHCWSDH